MFPYIKLLNTKTFFGILRCSVYIFFSVLIISCSPSKVDDFEYELFNDTKHLEVNRSNLLKLYELTNSELTDLLVDLNYEKSVLFNADRQISYIQKTDTVSGVFQLINLIEKPNRIVEISWTSMDGKDRFNKFREEAKRNEDIHIKKSDTYILRHKGKDYMAAISEVLSIAKSIRIMRMD